MINIDYCFGCVILASLLFKVVVKGGESQEPCFEEVVGLVRMDRRNGLYSVFRLQCLSSAQSFLIFL